MSRDMWHAHKHKFEELSKLSSSKEKSEKSLNALKLSLKNSWVFFGCLWPHTSVQSWTGKARIFASAWGNLFGSKWTSYLDSGNSKMSENGFNRIFPWVLGPAKFWDQKMPLLLPYTPPPLWANFWPVVTSNTKLGDFSDPLPNLIEAICNPPCWICSYIISLHATNNNTLPQIYLKRKFLCTYLCQN